MWHSFYQFLSLASPAGLVLGSPLPSASSSVIMGAMMMASPDRDVFQRIVTNGPSAIGVNGHAASYDGQILLDTSAIIGGRIAGVSRTGFLRGTIVIPSFVLDELRHVADSSDSLRRNRGRRGLEMLNKLRHETDIRIQIMDVDFRNGAEVDS